MTTAFAPPLVVWLGEAMFTFGPGRDITVGRGSDADIRVDVAQRQAISRIHLILRPDRGHWVAIDQSRNGIFINGARANNIPIDDDLRITLGAPDGPPLTFRITTQKLHVRPVTAPPPPAPTSPAAATPRPQHQIPAPTPPRPQQPPPPHSRPAPPAHRAAAPPPRPPAPTPPPTHPTPAPDTSDDVLARMTGVVKKVLPQRATPALPPGAITIGRHSDSTIRITDPLASRTHAYLLPAPTGTQIHDNGSNNGIFVNGVKVPAATLRPGDIVTIGNTDLLFSGGTTLAIRSTTDATGGVEARQLGLTVDGHQILTNVSFTARPGTLTAVIGPSGAGKSTLIKLLGGATAPTTGQVTFDGHDVHAEYASMRSRIGMVPQDDVVHRQLTVDQALSYAAQLRLPPDTSKTDRRAVVDRVLGELELTEHRTKRVDKLSGGQRKRASVALELLTGPSLLILDEPTSGLDPALDRQVMSMLRGLADAGRTVIVVTHSLTYLNMCDQVLLLAPGGKTAYAGPPAAIGAAMGTTDWADIFAWVSGQPDAAHAAFVARHPEAARPAATAAPAGPLGEPARTSTSRQMATLARRQIRLIVADRGYTLFLVLLPFILGALSLVVPGNVGLGAATTASGAPNEPTQLLILANIAAVFMGTALTIRDLVGERTIFRREQSVGLSSGAYLASKILVYSTFAALQTAIVTAIVVYGKGGPTQGALVFPNPIYDLYATLALTAIVSAILGLWFSSLARSNEQILPVLVVVIMLSIVFSGGLIPVTARLGLEQASWFLPARWGFAASASTIDLLKVAPLVTVDDPLWHHQLKWWALDMSVLALLGIVAATLVWRRLRLPAQDTPTAGSKTGGGAKVAAAVGVLVLLAGFITGLSVLTKGGGNRDTAMTPPTTMPTQGAAPEQKPVAANDLTALLLAPETAATAMNVAKLSGSQIAPAHAAGVATPPPCTGPVSAGAAGVYLNTGFVAVAGQTLTDINDAANTVTQYVTSYPGAEQAATVQDNQINAWRDCPAGTQVTFTAENTLDRTMTVGDTESTAGWLTVTFTEGNRTCQHVLGTNSNVVIDVLTCRGGTNSQALDIAKKIADNIP